ncbi:hypothetical protein C0Q70_10061 [Pomacea canaliculata]|uniref:Uncharacterized protein n=1 Tax=Pomacea canaliculata TaxID=400727 RepID=A0A2T7PBK0_POMCA|nr:hypothetical protein C0Q70_10061 [Pomacea canaliculata]
MNMRTPPSLLEDDGQDNHQSTDAPPQEVDFSEYMWMADELEEFDRQVEEELWEQAFIEACFEDMLAEEELHWYFSQLPAHSHACMTTVPWDSFYDSPLSQLSLDCRAEELLQTSKLNPEAPEFVPMAAMKK